MGDSKPGLQYNAWRRPLRRGLYVYRSSTVVAGVTPRELRAFHLDDDVRQVTSLYQIDSCWVGWLQVRDGGARRLGS